MSLPDMGSPEGGAPGGPDVFGFWRPALLHLDLAVLLSILSLILAQWPRSWTLAHNSGCAVAAAHHWVTVSSGGSRRAPALFYSRQV